MRIWPRTGAQPVSKITKVVGGSGLPLIKPSTIARSCLTYSLSGAEFHDALERFAGALQIRVVGGIGHEKQTVEINGERVDVSRRKV